MFDKKLKIYISIFLIWLFTISGIFGILSDDYRDWFLSLSPLHLMLSFGILLVNIDNINPKVFIALGIPFALGFITEVLGVNYGLIFGSYAYGENLGYKLLGVPLIICINWALLTALTADIAKLFFKNRVLSALTGALLMVLLDVLLEVSAPRFDFWEFENGDVPIQNYIGWLATAFIAHLGYQAFKVKSNKIVSGHLFISIAVFFGVFLFF